MPMEITRLCVTQVLLSAATVNTTGVVGAPSYAVHPYAEAYLALSVGGQGGTSPTLDVKAQTSADGSTWFDLGSAFAQIVAAATPAVLKLTNFGPFLRVFATVGGTAGPNFTGVSLTLVLKS